MLRLRRASVGWFLILAVALGYAVLAGHWSTVLTLLLRATS